MILYNLFPLLAGPFSGWREHFTRAAGMGFDWVFINPIQQVGASRSLYSIADYFQFNPVLLDPASGAPPEEQVKQMIAQAHAAGLKVMIDLVINHCAIDSPLTLQHPEWFARDADGKIVNSSCHHNGEKVVWQDLAQFDHEHTRDPEGLYGLCLKVVEHLLAHGFDGFRCDAAYLVPPQFWRRLIREAKAKHPQTLFVAETLGCTADQTKAAGRAGFDYVFNSSKWWNLHDWWLIEQYNLIRETTCSISFPESHDTPRLCEEFQGNVDGLKQRYLFSALFSAGVMMPMGFEYGLRKSLHVVHTTPADWQPNNLDLSGYIGRVNAIKRAHAVFREESPTSILPCQNPNILLMWKASARHKDEALLILNKDVERHQEFYTDHFRHFVQAGAPLRDVSPEYPLQYIHEPFHYALRPGQGIVLVTSRN
ncbi:MAG: alpha-amylase [Verrucomicrobia bacterium]|nr:MAG: alpha-amylase [Verrucomicrobiota bacterium]